jgi:hypothetical protein
MMAWTQGGHLSMSHTGHFDERQHVELPTIFVILQPPEQLIDDVVEAHLLGSQTRITARPIGVV